MDTHQKAGQKWYGDGTADHNAVGQRGTGPGEIAAGGDADGDIVGQLGVGQGAEADEVESGGLDDGVLAAGALGHALSVELVKGDGTIEGRREGLGSAAGEIAVYGGLDGACGAGRTCGTGLTGLSVCPCRTRRPCGSGRSSHSCRAGRPGRGDVIRKVAIILENQGNIKK